MSLKKILFCLTLISSAIMNHVMHAAEFNPENHSFSNKEDIKKWLHPVFIDYIDIVQLLFGLSMPENLEGLNKCSVIRPIKNNDGDTRFYGKTFPILPLPLTSLLKLIKGFRTQLSSPEEKLILLEVGGGSGLVALFMTLAAGPNAIIVYNDLSKYEIEQGKKLFKEVTEKIPLPMENIIFDVGDANGLPDRFPEYINGTAIVHTQNVEHFMNPAEHQKFAGNLLKMVCPTGYLHLVAHTIPVGCGVKGNPFFDIYKKNKKQAKLYPMFLRIDQIQKQLGGKYDKMNTFFTNDDPSKKTVSIPNENDICNSKGSIKEKMYINYNGQETECYVIQTNTLLNYFTPTIYYNAYKKAAEGEKISITQQIAGFLNYTADELYCDFNNDQELNLTLSILRKT